MAEAALALNDDDHAPDIDTLQAGADDEARAALDDNATDAPNPEAEKVARIMGWKPLEEWKGDPSGWRSAEDFVAELPQVLKRTRKTNERLEQDFARVVAQVAKLDQNQRNALDAELDREFDAAWDAGDYDKAKKIREKQKELVAAKTPDEPAALSAFKARNPWFNVDDEATAYAASLDATYAARGGGKITDPDAHMRKVEEGVKKRFPELFVDTKTEQQRPKPPLVNRGGRTDAPRRPNGQVTVADLTPLERKAAAEMGVTEADYAKALTKIRTKESAR